MKFKVGQLVHIPKRTMEYYNSKLEYRMVMMTPIMYEHMVGITLPIKSIPDYAIHNPQYTISDGTYTYNFHEDWLEPVESIEDILSNEDINRLK